MAAWQSTSDGDGIFGVPLEALSLRWPPLINELQELLLAHVATADQLAAALSKASHASVQQLLDAVCSAIDGAHGARGIGVALTAVRDPGPSQVAAVSLGALLRLLVRLPSPAVPCELYPLVLSSGSGAVAPLLRKRLPADRAAFIDAIGSLFGRLLLRCSFDDGLTPATTEHESALHALLFVLTPALLRPAPDVPMPLAERTAATRAVRALLCYHLQRERFRSLGGAPGAHGDGYSSSPSLDARVQAAAGPATMAAASQAGISGAPAVGAWQSSTPPSHEAMRSEPATATPTQGGRSRGGALAMRSVASAISQMFEREVRTFCTFCRALEAQEARVDQTRRWPCMPLPPHTPICCMPVGIFSRSILSRVPTCGVQFAATAHRGIPSPSSRAEL